MQSETLVNNYAPRSINVQNINPLLETHEIFALQVIQAEF